MRGYLDEGGEELGHELREDVGLLAETRGIRGLGRTQNDQ